MKGINIVSTGRCLPEKVIDNDTLSTFVDTSDEWIYTRTGIKMRHKCEEESNTFLACGAAKEALKKAKVKENIDENDIGVVIVATTTGDNAFPSTACMVAKELGLSNEIIAFDISAACSGFVYGLEIVRGLLINSPKKYGLLIGSEQISKILNYEDRTTCVLFGDGAGAALIKLDDSLYVHKAYADGNFEGLNCTGVGKKDNYLHMDGKAVFKAAVTAFDQAIKDALDEKNLTLDDIDHVVCHQANVRIINHVANKHKESKDKFYVNIDRYANTSAASIPIALDELYENNKIKKGQKVLLVAFGAGFTWSSAIYTA
ncbi:beta-ketoacyl-ACP synthase III [Lachnobacterium bovis]|uniref:Beta-ketoacyl-[acyl-carrier-protein] synthase III n=1 Tax=Lachnobacterium bovis TaxID=140626 RepID=A0A1H9T3W8_9FIRM|nr:beta-ketoacyl-ACP synthase III [Lachnobacterium bovis]SER91838.1 3-oxoacyl-[acyl-carrier-protein] synthase-3 [Lachnobacterium bovis]